MEITAVVSDTAAAPWSVFPNMQHCMLIQISAYYWFYKLILYYVIPLGFIGYALMFSLSLQLKTWENVVPPEEPMGCMQLRVYCGLFFPPPLIMCD